MTIEPYREPALSLDNTRAIVHATIASGDYSRLDDAQRGDVVLALCRATGLNPLTKPFDFLKLQGKLILYANRNAGDQLAAQHRITRRIVRGPEIVDVGGKKLVLCVCEASTPDGRTEHATATVDLADPCGLANVYMKAETKAKRRAALAVTGLSILDESEARDTGSRAEVANDNTAEAKPAPETKPGELPAPTAKASDVLAKSIATAKTWSAALALLPAQPDKAVGLAVLARWQRGANAAKDEASIAQARKLYDALPAWVRELAPLPPASDEPADGYVVVREPGEEG